MMERMDVISTPAAAISLDRLASSLFSGEALSTTFSIAELKISAMNMRNAAVMIHNHS